MQEMKTAVRLTGADAGGGVQHLLSSSIPTLTPSHPRVGS